MTSHVDTFNQQWELLAPDFIKTQEQIKKERTEIQANSPSQTEFGGCWWNPDIAKGRSLLSQRAKEINSMVENILNAIDIDTIDINSVYLSSQTFLKESEVSTKLKDLIERLDKSIWNLKSIWNRICEFFWGTSRSIKNEGKKLEALYQRYENIVDAIMSRSEFLLDESQEKINGYIDDDLNFWKGVPGGNINPEISLGSCTKELNKIKSVYHRQIFLKKLNQGISEMA